LDEWRASILVVLQICLLTVALQGPAYEAHAFQRGQTAVVIIGQGSFPSITASARSVNGPGGLTFDGAGDLWVVDGSNYRVLEFAPPFRSNMNASLVLGQPDFVSNPINDNDLYDVGANIFLLPQAIAFDAKGNLWITDYWKSRILEFVPPFTNGMNASKVVGEPNFFDEFWFHNPDVNAARNRMAGPAGLAFDRFGNLWVADVNYNRVLRFEPPFANGMDASLVIGEPDFTTGMCPPYQGGYACPENDPGPGHLRNPGTVTFDDSGNLWVTDAGSLTGGRILEFRPPFRNGMNATIVSEIPASSVAFDRDGNLWAGIPWAMGVWAGHVVEFHPPFNDKMNASFAMGSGYVDDPKVLIDANHMNPSALAFDSAGNLWVSDFQGKGICSGGRCYGSDGRILAFDAQTHSVLGPTGRVYFRNDGGLLAPLLSIPSTVEMTGMMSYPEGLFNLTIQGLLAGGSVKIVINFPQRLPSGVGWWSVECYNGCEQVQLHELPASEVQIDGNNMTLTLTNASEDGVISVLGGPAIPPITSSSVSSTNATSLPQPQTGPPISLMFTPLAVVIATIAFVLYRKRRRHEPT
jgi:sugar lactone lactonase YvrE